MLAAAWPRQDEGGSSPGMKGGDGDACKEYVCRAVGWGRALTNMPREFHPRKTTKFNAGISQRKFEIILGESSSNMSPRGRPKQG